MQITVANYNTKLQAVDVGIMMWCLISQLHFIIIHGTHIAEEATNTAKGVMTKKQMDLPPSRAFMNDITILVQSKFDADELLQRYHNLFT